MPQYSDGEIHAVVQKVIQRMAGTGHGKEGPVPPAVSDPPARLTDPSPNKVIAIGSDHGGFELKENLKMFLSELNYAVTDCGAPDKNPVDYPDIAHLVAKMVSGCQAWRGIIIDGAGIGSCMAANKVPGVRAALCYDYATAVNSREHNNANVLTLGAGLIGVNLARQIVKTWLETDFGGGRHAGRVDKITMIENQYSKKAG